MRATIRRLVLAAAVLAGCSGGGGPPADAGTPEPPPDGLWPPHARALPFDYARPERGLPLTAAELTAATDRFLDLLARTRYFESCSISPSNSA